MKAIGIDLGTTSICGVLLDGDSGKVLSKYTLQSEAFLQSAHVWEKIQDTGKIIGLAEEIIEQLIKESDEGVAVIGITGQMHGIVYYDEQGKAVSPLYTWQDQRGNLAYQDTTYAGMLKSCTGYGNVTDFYNRINGIRLKEAVGYCTVHDYLAMHLCGLKRAKIHTSDAASFGCYNLAEHTFSYENTEEVLDGFHIIGSYRGIPVSLAIGDNQSSVFSTLADENALLVNIGTGSQITVISDRIVTVDDVECRPYFEGKYLLVGAALCGGRAYSILKNFYHELLQTVGVTTDVYQVMNGLLKGRTESSLTVDTRFAGTRRQPELTGSITGITTENLTPADLTYGVLQGMIDELWQLYLKMEVKRHNIIGSGNAIRLNSTLIKIIEKQFGGSLRIPEHMEEAAFGAALYGLVACGAFPNMAQAQGLIRYNEI